MGLTNDIDNKGRVKTKSYSTCVKILQLWLTSFAIGIPLLRLLLFLDFRNSEIVIVVFFSLLLFATMYILDVNDNFLKADGIQSNARSNDDVTNAEHSHSINISPDQHDQKFEATENEADRRFDEPLRFDGLDLRTNQQEL